MRNPFALSCVSYCISPVVLFTKRAHPASDACSKEESFSQHDNTMTVPVLGRELHVSADGGQSFGARFDSKFPATADEASSRRACERL